MTLVTVHQPDFAPWLGFFDRYVACDVFIVLDDVQFLRRGWHHRDRILLNDKAFWLTVPIHKKGQYEQLIKDTMIDDSRDWRRKHLASLQQAYGRCHHFETVLNQLRDVYAAGHQKLSDLNLAIIEMVAEIANLPHPQIVMASEFALETRGTERIRDLVLSVGGTQYLSGLGARDYLDEAILEESSISLEWRGFKHPTYDQDKPDFTPGLSVLDALFHIGGASTGRLLTQ